MIVRQASTWSGTKEVQWVTCVTGYIWMISSCVLHVSPVQGVVHGSPPPCDTPSALYTSVIAVTWEAGVVAVTNTGTLHRRTNITTQHCNLIRTCPLRIAVAYHIRNVEAMIVVCLMNWLELHYMDLTYVNDSTVFARLLLNLTSRGKHKFCNRWQFVIW